MEQQKLQRKRRKLVRVVEFKSQYRETISWQPGIGINVSPFETAKFMTLLQSALDWY
jgi:hypothetical protein